MMTDFALSPKVSVVLPVYNPGPGIHRCIASLRSQTLREIELIFVDDRGSDGAMDAVRAAAREDDRIRVLVNPENLGPGPSRNAGIEAARGEYLSFVDPDDFVAPDFLELLYRGTQAGRPDIVKGSAVIVHEGDDPLALRPDTRARDVIRAGLAAGKPLYTLFSWEHWTALYRRAFLLESGARYGATRNGEDTTFLLRACHAAKRFEPCDDARYYYVLRERSATHEFDAARLSSQIDALREQVDYLAGPLVGDPDAPFYVRKRVCYYLSLQLRASNIPGLEAAAERFLEDIRAQVCRLPFTRALGQDSVALRALIEHGANLCQTTVLHGWEQAQDRMRMVDNWTDFMLAHPDFDPRLAEQALRVLKRAYAGYAELLAAQGPTERSNAFYRRLQRQRECLKELL